jgi:hypothetical protein
VLSRAKDQRIQNARVMFASQRAWLWPWVAIALAACATQSSQRSQPLPAARYQGTCELAGIESVPAPLGQEDDSVVLVARYRPGDAAAGGEAPWAMKFQINRARVNDLRSHLESHATVVCSPDRQASGSGSPQIDLPPFEGQAGQPIE